MKIILTDIGERLQMLRKSLGISQRDLASTLEIGQNQISRIENGLGGTIDLLLLLINFYGEHFYTNHLFSEHFEVIRRDEAFNVENSYNSIALERLKLLHTDFTDQITGIINIMEQA